MRVGVVERVERVESKVWMNSKRSRSSSRRRRRRRKREEEEEE